MRIGSFRTRVPAAGTTALAMAAAAPTETCAYQKANRPANPHLPRRDNNPVRDRTSLCRSATLTSSRTWVEKLALRRESG
jgi:hypothetical protein